MSASDKDVRDGLKALEDVFQPDIRHSFFQRIDSVTGKTYKNTLELHYQDIERYSLSDSVPDDIVTQFDVARNIYIYAWYEYRFFNEAESKVLTVLEYALRERIGNAEIHGYIKERKRQAREYTGTSIRLMNGLKTLIEYCRDHRLIQNSGFSAWHRHPRLVAEENYDTDVHQKMISLGLDEYSYDYSSLVIPDPDDGYDHIQHLIDHTNKVRNTYAHGSSMLHANVLYSFEMVSEFINQLYSKNS